MNNFNCKKCNELHKLVTLFEFPQPDIISKITSGKLKKDLYALGKNFLIIDRQTVIVQSELSVDIINEEDKLDMLVWVKIEKEEYLKKIQNLREVEEIKMFGILYHEIPFYKNTKKLPVEVLINLNGKTSDKPKVVDILKDNSFKKDFEAGIKLSKLKTHLIELYHFLD